MPCSLPCAVLPLERGYPFQLVAEDKWGYKRIRWVDRLELSSDTSYRGFWEERGYNDGDAGVRFASRETGVLTIEACLPALR